MNLDRQTISPPLVGIGLPTTTGQPLADLLVRLSADVIDQMVIVVRAAEPDRPEPSAPTIGGLSLFDPRTVVATGQASTAEPIAIPERHVALLPDGWKIVSQGGFWRLVQDPAADQRAVDSVGQLFRSLAKAAGDRAIGILTAGCHGDGESGLRALAEAGGVVLRQSDSGGRLDGVESATPVDFCGEIDALADELTKYVRHLYRTHAWKADKAICRRIEEALPEITTRLREVTEHNFRHYKTSTLVRRVRRRIQVMRDADVDSYLTRLKRDRQEVVHLFKELLIGVTQFFRDPAVFASLADNVLPQLFAPSADDGHSSEDVEEPHSSIRVWVPGCSTGQEAYTLAMLIAEHAERTASDREIQIFATDIDEHALQVARRGVYPRSIEAEISKERLDRYFRRTGDEYKVTRQLREMCLFSCHSIISDPPFSRVDLISCRNLLIYMGPHLQQKMISVFHYALRPRGYLVVGTSESLANHGELFQPFDATHRISRRRATGVSSPLFHTHGAIPRENGGSRHAPLAGGETDLGPIAQRILLDEFAPVMAVVTEAGEIRYSSGDFARYVSLPAGTFQNDIVRLARPGLRVGLRASLREAIRERRRVTHDDLSVDVDGLAQRITLIIQPMPSLGDEASLFMVVIKELGPTVDRSEAARSSDRGAVERLVEQLERELRTTRADLESTVQDLEAANEELKSSNEELLSMNEELQSTNEELETSKEEIQTAKDVIQQANNDLRNLLRSTRIAVLFLSDDLCIRSFTPAVTRIYNMLPGDVGRPLNHVTHRALNMPPLAPVVDEHWPEDEPSGGRLRIKTDEDHWFLRQILPYHASDGRRDGMVVVFTDITELQRAERARDEAEIRTALAFDAGRFGYWHWDIDSNAAVHSRIQRELFGLPLEGDVTMDDFWSRIHPEDAPRLRQNIESVIQNELPFTDEFRIVHTDGHIAWIGVRGAIVNHDQRRGRMLLGVNWDITERKEVEERLKNVSWQADAANRAKSEFLANMSHEIRTPMTAILGYADLIAERLDDPTALEQIDTIRRNGRFLLDIINDILDLSKIDAGKMEIRNESWPIGRLIREVCSLMDVRVVERGLRLGIEFESALPEYIRTDATRLRQILVNLIGNAIKFTETGSITIRARFLPSANKIEIDVADTGIGIPDDIQPLLFAPFTQVDTSGNRPFSGTGLGLAITRRLVTMLGGEIFLRSAVGQGSCFTVSLPTGPLDGVAMAVPSATPVVCAPETESRGPIPLNILVVDDSRDIRLLAQALLKRLGATVAVADGGLAALRILDEHRGEGKTFDVVIMDVQMPGMDGPSAVRRIRESGHSLPIIALTANAMHGDREKCLDQGYTDYLSKPLDIADLRLVLGQLSDCAP